MPWVRLDEMFPEHPKVLAVGDEAAWLFVCAIAYCNRNLTDGLVHETIIGRLTGHKRPAELVKRLVGVGMFEPCPDGWQIHDYSQYQSSRAKVIEERTKARERMARIRGTNGEHTSDVRLNIDERSPYPIPSRSRSRTSSSSSTGSGKAATSGDEDDDRIGHAIEIHAAWASRSADNPKRYARTVAANDRRESVPDLLRVIEKVPDATAGDLCRDVFGMSEVDVHQYTSRLT